VDDAAIFVAPFKNDVTNLANILTNFGNITGLHTNFHKSLVAPIRCNDIDLNDISSDLLATIVSFTLKYLGLPLP
jgi:hypothetical protein